MNKIITSILMSFLALPIMAQQVKYPENLHGYVRINSNFVPTPCEINACNAVDISMVKEFYDNLNDSKKVWYDFDLYPAKLQKIAYKEHSALAYSEMDMTTVVKNNINQKKLAETVNQLTKVIKDYYKNNDLNRNFNVQVRFSIIASNKGTKAEYHGYNVREMRDGKIVNLDIKDIQPIGKEMMKFFNGENYPIITDSEKEIEIKFFNIFVTNNYDFVRVPQ